MLRWLIQGIAYQQQRNFRIGYIVNLCAFSAHVRQPVPVAVHWHDSNHRTVTLFGVSAVHHREVDHWQPDALLTPVVTVIYSTGNFRFIQAGVNKLNGSLPTTIGGLTTLQYLDFQQNSLTGPVPDTLSNLTRLTVLRLSYNSFDSSLSMPSIIRQLTALT